MLKATAMNKWFSIRVWLMLVLIYGSLSIAWAQESSTNADPMRLEMNTAMVRSALDWLNMNNTLLHRLPDVRLKIDTSFGMEGESSGLALQQLGGMEFRLPGSGPADIWMGYEDPVDGTGPRRATLSIKHGF